MRDDRKDLVHTCRSSAKVFAKIPECSGKPGPTGKHFARPVLFNEEKKSPGPALRSRDRKGASMKGKQPENLRTAWIDCAHRMGYFCAENNETSLPFDGLMYRDAVVVAVKLKKVRYSPGEDFHLEKKFPGEVRALRTLPLPSTVARELGSGPRTSGSVFGVAGGIARGQGDKPRHVSPGSVCRQRYGPHAKEL